MLIEYRMSLRSSTEYIGPKDEPTHIYYNADIINNTSTDVTSAGLAKPDPPLRFNETRDSALVKDASKYFFSIVRFTLDGPNRDLPLLIPSIQLGQVKPDLTSYSFAIAFQATYTTNVGDVYFEIQPAPTFLTWVPECQNTLLAPVPAPPITTQDISSRYYYLSSYQWFVELVNATLSSAMQNLYAEFQLQWLSAPGVTDPFPYATLADFQGAVFNTPQFTFDESSNLFSIWLDSRAFGQPIVPFVQIPYSPGVAQLTYKPVARQFMNTNSQGLFANFPVIYWNRVTPLPSVSVGGVILPAFNTVPQPGYVYEITAPNKFYQNVVNFALSPYGNPGNIVPVGQQQSYYKVTQDFQSNDSIWSPIASIVITSTLLPIKSEFIAAPTELGTSNIGNSASTGSSAFTPIITDIALDTTVGGSAAYRQLISYAPSAEYRMSDFNPSKTDIQQIDIQVYWKNRLDGQLYPVYMYNLASAHIKVLLRLKTMNS